MHLISEHARTAGVQGRPRHLAVTAAASAALLLAAFGRPRHGAVAGQEAL